MLVLNVINHACRIIFDDDDHISSRNCTPVNEEHYFPNCLEDHKEKICDYPTEKSNYELEKSCLNGYEGKCDKIFAQHVKVRKYAHAPYSDRCYKFIENDCHTTIVRDGSNTCKLFTCDLVTFGDLIEFGKEKCITDKNSVVHCRCYGEDCQKLSDEELEKGIKCYDERISKVILCKNSTNCKIELGECFAAK
uniref:DUF19 domain-containing protein n=1 Tax=Panagrolaimus sp. JU765 TaxID=591449 RepID=A0AC34RAW0_9BILA